MEYRNSKRKEKLKMKVKISQAAMRRVLEVPMVKGERISRISELELGNTLEVIGEEIAKLAFQVLRNEPSGVTLKGRHVRVASKIMCERIGVKIN